MSEIKRIQLPKPLPYQKDIVDMLDDDEVKFVSFLKSRQSGGSFLNKLLLIKWGLENKRVRISYITPTLKLGKLFFSEICEAIQPYIKSVNKSDLIIQFHTDSTVQFFSAESEDTIRGFQFEYQIIDEAAYMKPDFFDRVLRATTLIKGRKVILCSTPNLAEGFFHQHVEFGYDTNMKKYRTKKITIYDNPFVDKEEIETIKRTVPAKVFRQEYLAEFLDGEGTVFSNYKQCINDNPSKTGNYYAAIDWAKQNDYTVVTIINDLNEVVAIERWTDLDYTVQVEKVAQILNYWKPEVTISEENNIGAVVNELLTKQYKGYVEQVTLNNSLKREIIENLVVAFETKQISIPNNDKLLSELSYFSCIYNPQTQTVKYAAKSGLHDDMVISLAYAYYAQQLNQVKSILL